MPVYEVIAVLVELSLVFSLALMTRGILPLREITAKHIGRLRTLVKSEDYSGDDKLPASLSFSISLWVWVAKILLYVPHACFVVALLLLGGMVFSPATELARWSLLGFATAVFVSLLLFTFLNRKALYTSSTPVRADD